MNIINLLLVMSFSIGLLTMNKSILKEMQCTNLRIVKSINESINPYLKFNKPSFRLPSFSASCKRKIEIVNNLKSDVDYEKPKRK
jgi:hypothetical protein